MKKLILFTLLTIACLVAKGQQPGFYSPGIPPGSVSKPFSTRILTHATDSLTDLIFGVDGNKFYGVITRAWYNANPFVASAVNFQGNATTSSKFDLNNTILVQQGIGIGTAVPSGNALSIYKNVGPQSLIKMVNPDTVDGRSSIQYTSRKNGLWDWELGLNPGGKANVFGLRNYRLDTAGVSMAWDVDRANNNMHIYQQLYLPALKDTTGLDSSVMYHNGKLYRQLGGGGGGTDSTLYKTNGGIHTTRLVEITDGGTLLIGDTTNYNGLLLQRGSGAAIDATLSGSASDPTHNAFFWASSGGAASIVSNWGANNRGINVTAHDTSGHNQIRPIMISDSYHMGVATNGDFSDYEVAHDSSLTSKKAVVRLIDSLGHLGTLTSITPGYGFTSSTPITTSGTMTIDTTKIATQYYSAKVVGSDGIVTGLVTTTLGTTATTTAGTYRLNNTLVTKGSSTNTTIDAQDATLNRYDLIVGDASGTFTKVQGTLAADAVEPDIPTNKALIASIYIPATGGTVTSGGGGGNGTTKNALNGGTGIIPFSYNGSTAGIKVVIDTAVMMPKANTKTLAQLQTAFNLKANLASPTFTGTPTAPTASVGTNTTQIATTAFVLANQAGVTFANPSGLIGMTASNGSATTADRSDATHAIDPAIAPTWTGVHTFSPSVTASSSLARGEINTSTLTVAANNDVLVGYDLAPSFPNAYGVKTGGATLVGGSGYTNGTYTSVPLTSTQNGTGAIATIVVSGGAVSTVTITTSGKGYAIGDVLTTANTNIGGTGSGFTWTVTANNFSGVVINPIRINGISIGLGGTNADVHNMAIGNGVLPTSYGVGNTGIGYQALNANTSGTNNFALAYQALTANTTGSFNVAMGSSALNTNTTSSDNIAIGALSMPNGRGGDNVAIGYTALASLTSSSNSNVGIGTRALNANTSASQNHAIGYDALFNITTGSDNVAIGTYAGAYVNAGTVTANTTGNQSVLIGTRAENLSNGDTNEIAIGYQVTGNGSNTVTIGNASVTNNYFKGAINVPHMVGSSSAPTIAAGTGAGTSPTVSVSGNDLIHKVTITTGTGSAASAIVGTITFNSAYASAPKISLTPANAAAAALNGTAQVYVDDASTSTTAYVIKVGSGGLTDATTYLFYAHVAQ